MTRKARMKSGTGVYHAMWRGANRQVIFHDDEDRHVFLDILQQVMWKTNIRIHGWCLMDNHAHLLIKEGDEAFSKTMQRMGVKFAKYYNEKYETMGHLFQDRFKSECVESMGSLLTVIRYIHQNPVKAGMVGRPDEWEWSSCREYYGTGFEKRKILDTSIILGFFQKDHIAVARASFKLFNESPNEDECLEDIVHERRLADKEASAEIKKVLGGIEIAQVKSLPKPKRDEALRKIRKIKNISIRQSSRILGVSRTLLAQK